jgi:hypothetical protein
MNDPVHAQGVRTGHGVDEKLMVGAGCMRITQVPDEKFVPPDVLTTDLSAARPVLPPFAAAQNVGGVNHDGEREHRHFPRVSRSGL